MGLKSWLRITMIRADVRLDAVRTANGSDVLAQDDVYQRRCLKWCTENSKQV